MESFGTINHIRGVNPENNWACLNTSKGILVGYVENPQKGDHIKAQGSWFNNPKYGMEFRASKIELESSFGRYNMTHALSNAKLAGWGKAAANKLYDYYGLSMLESLSDSAALKKLGFTRKQVISASEFSVKNKGSIIIRSLLMKAGIGYKTSEKIVSESDITELIKNPFSLLGKVARLSFYHVDRIFLAGGGDKESTFRFKAALSEVLRKANDKGHTGINQNDWFNSACALIGIVPSHEIDLSEEFIEFPINSGVIYSKECYKQESLIAKRLKECATISPLKYECTVDNQLSEEQRKALHNAKESGVSIVTGGPGTGKTTVISNLCELAKINNISVYMLAPTGLASRRMTESVNDASIPAMTIHSFTQA